jgi:manganese-dependent inorganic pyrophosphatase
MIDAEREVMHLIGYPRSEAGIYVLKDILSRKKQLMPAIIELVEKATEG